MNEEDFACDSFTPQKWRQDMCRKCYQPRKLHDKKTSSPSTMKKTQSKRPVSSPASSSASGHANEAKTSTQPTSQRSSPQLKTLSAVSETRSSKTAPHGCVSLPHTEAEASPTEALHRTVTQGDTASGTAEQSSLESSSVLQPTKQRNIPAKPSPPAVQRHRPFGPVTTKPTSPIPHKQMVSKENGTSEAHLVAGPQEGCSVSNTSDEVSVVAELDQPMAAHKHVEENGLDTPGKEACGEEMASQQLIKGPFQDRPMLNIGEVSHALKPCESDSFEEERAGSSHKLEENGAQKPMQTSVAGVTTSLATSDDVETGNPTGVIADNLVDKLNTKKIAEAKGNASQGNDIELKAVGSLGMSDVSKQEVQTEEKSACFLEPVTWKQELKPDHGEEVDPLDLPSAPSIAEQQLPLPPPLAGGNANSTSPNVSFPPLIAGDSPCPYDEEASPPSAPGVSPPPAPGVPPPPAPGVPPPLPIPVVGGPPPPPPPPPLIGIPSDVPVHVRVIRPPADKDNGPPSSPGNISLPDSEENLAQNDVLTEHGQLMQSIRSGVQLRPTPQPEARNPCDVKVWDVASELQERMMKRQKAELDKATSKLDHHGKTANEIREQLYRMRGTPTYLHHLVSMLERIKMFLNTCEISVEVLEKRCRWPSNLIADLEFVVSFMDGLTAKISEVERLCQRTMELKAEQLNVEIVQRCVGEVLSKASQIKTAHDQHTRYSDAFVMFPVDPIDIHRLMRRAAEAISPILDRLYIKALQTHEILGDPTISKFDLNFRLQNAQRQLRMCCRMSDSLFANLSVPRHPNYSEAMLKVSELESQHQYKLAVLNRKGNWDEDETVVLQPPQSSRQVHQQVEDETALVQQVTRALINGKEIPEDAFGMSEELYLRCQLSLLRAAVAQDNTKAVDSFISLSTRVFTSSDVKARLAFEWLLEAVIKGNHLCIQHMVEVVGLPINCQSADVGNSLLHIASRRQDLSTMGCLVRLGINPLLKNNSSRTALDMLALKCFPPQTFPDTKVKEFPFDLSPYINNESLSDCVLVSSDGEKFYAHKLVLCAQSGVFRSMLESEHWANSRQDNQVSLPSVSSQVLKLLLQYLYTGQSAFPHDDLNLWIDLLSAADQFLLEHLRLHCEKVLSGKIDSEVVVAMYWAAFQLSAHRLLANCSCFILEHYHELEDEGHGTFLHLLENARIGTRK